MTKSTGEEELARQLRALGIAHMREFRWNPLRRWRADFRIDKFLIEVEGGAFNGGHRRGIAANKDCERHNDAVMSGWRPLRFTPAMIADGSALVTIEAALGRRK